MSTAPGARTLASGAAHDAPAGPAWALALLALAVTWSIAPMGIATGVLFAATMVAMVRAKQFEWPRTGIEPAAFAWAAALVLSAVCSEDRAGSMPRLTKALFPFLAGLVAITARDERASRRALAVRTPGAIKGPMR